MKGELHLLAVEDPKLQNLHGESDFFGIPCGEENVAGEFFGTVQVAEEGLDVVFDPKRNLAPKEALPEVRHGEVNK